jgi:hypothetical protein
VVDGDTNKKKDIVFLCLETKMKQQPTPNQGQSTQDMYQQAYDNWNRRNTHVSRHEMIEWRRQTTVTTRRDNTLAIDTNSLTANNTSTSDEAQQPRCVTPEANTIDKDIKDLLKPFIKD